MPRPRLRLSLDGAGLGDEVSAVASSGGAPAELHGALGPGGSHEPAVTIGADRFQHGGLSVDTRGERSGRRGLRRGRPGRWMDGHSRVRGVAHTTHPPPLRAGNVGFTAPGGGSRTRLLSGGGGGVGAVPSSTSAGTGTSSSGGASGLPLSSSASGSGGAADTYAASQPPPPSASRQLSAVAFDDLAIEARLGAGASATVYRARHRATGQVFALKCIQLYEKGEGRGGGEWGVGMRERAAAERVGCGYRTSAGRPSSAPLHCVCPSARVRRRHACSGARPADRGAGRAVRCRVRRACGLLRRHVPRG